MEEVVVEEVVFYHDESATKHGERRKNSFKNWRRDRKHWKKYPMTDIGFTKRILHRKNRKIYSNPDMASVTYYKESGMSLKGVCWART